MVCMDVRSVRLRLSLKLMPLLSMVDTDILMPLDMLDTMVLDMLDLAMPSLPLPSVSPTLPTLASALTILEPLFHVVARSVRLRLRPMLMLRLLSFMEDMDTHMVLDTTVLDMPVLAMLVLAMLDLAMHMVELLPPTLLSATPLLTLPSEPPTLPMLECAPTTLELRSLVR